MELKYENPYLRRSKFQSMYAPTMTSSCTSLLSPAISSCPRKKYSQTNWYDYKSSSFQLSEKIVYRMNQEYQKMQADDSRYYEYYKHIDTCLLTNECKKNPFRKQDLAAQKISSKGYLAESFNNPYWAEDKNKSTLNLSQTSRYTGRDAAASDRNRLKMTFGEENQEFWQTKNRTQFRKQSLQTLGGRPQDKGNGNEGISKGTNKFNLEKYRKMVQSAPNKVTIKEKTFYFVKIGLQD